MGQTPLSDFFYKIWHGEGVPDPHPHAKFHHHGFRNGGWSQSPKSSKYGIFALSDFYKIWHGEGVPDQHPHAKFHYCGFKNVGCKL